MRGAEYFFDVAVLPEFSDGPGVAILRRYRVRLFIPWLVEGAILGALWMAGLLACSFLRCLSAVFSGS